MRRAEEVTWQPNYIFLYLIVNILLGSFGVCVCYAGSKGEGKLFRKQRKTRQK